MATTIAMTMTPPTTERQQALGNVLTRIERSFGQGSIMRLGEAQALQVETISTGALTLDVALGGELPKSRVIEIFGPKSAGKTTLARHAIASIQAQGGAAAFIDTEHALDPTYAAAIGVEYLSQHIDMAQAIEAAVCTKTAES